MNGERKQSYDGAYSDIASSLINDLMEQVIRKKYASINPEEKAYYEGQQAALFSVSLNLYDTFRATELFKKPVLSVEITPFKDRN